MEEVQKLCDVHADLFRAGLEKGEQPQRMPGHPVHTYLAENQVARKKAAALASLVWFGSAAAIRQKVLDLKSIIVHYERKENQLFPFLERSGFTGPSKVMWGKHDEIRGVFRDLEAACAMDDSKTTRKLARDLVKRIRMMIFMEEKILFPNALKRLSEKDWVAVRRGEDAIGFAWVKPGASWDPALAANQGQGMYANFNTAINAAAGSTDQAGSSSSAVPSAATPIPLSVGSLPLDYLDRILKALPVDVSFVDADDKVMYYSDSPHRVFPRSPGIIGRSVQNCHPHKSVAVVEKILEAFKKKEKDSADFWIQMNGQFILISYKAIYDDAGSYLGTLEISQNVTDIRALEGQRRLLDW
ncbi:MAG: PAS domain-containing protein [Spirochaetes bacterium]|nr:PAS domain-containing protein [Spirochaetota bacterium]